jgi:hypothetical protein
MTFTGMTEQKQIRDFRVKAAQKLHQTTLQDAGQKESVWAWVQSADQGSADSAL